MYAQDKILGLTRDGKIHFLVDPSRLLQSSVISHDDFSSFSRLHRLFRESGGNTSAAIVDVKKLQWSVTYVSESKDSRTGTCAARESPDLGVDRIQLDGCLLESPVFADSGMT